MSITGAVKKVDTYVGKIVLMDGAEIALEDIMEMESELFKKM